MSKQTKLDRDLWTLIECVRLAEAEQARTGQSHGVRRFRLNGGSRVWCVEPRVLGQRDYAYTSEFGWEL